MSASNTIEDRPWLRSAHARNSDQFATTALRDALQRKVESEKRLKELGLAPRETMKELIKTGQLNNNTRLRIWDPKPGAAEDVTSSRLAQTLTLGRTVPKCPRLILAIRDSGKVTGFALTFIEATGIDRKTRRELTAAKTVYPPPRPPKQYDNVWLWRFWPKTYTDFEAFAAALKAAAPKPKYALIRGAPVEGLNLKEPQHRYSAKKRGSRSDNR